MYLECFDLTELLVEEKAVKIRGRHNYLVNLAQCEAAGALSCWRLGRAGRCHRGSDELFTAQTCKREDSCRS